MNSLLKKAIAEGLGTFVLVFCACGTAIMTGNVVATSLAFGLVIVAMAYVIGGISGCHINPAVSIAMLVAKKMTPKEFLVYVAAQFVGAIISAALLFGIISMRGVPMFAWATNGVIANTAPGYIGSLLVEIVLTFVFVYAIMGVTSKTDNKAVAGIVIGLSLTLVHLVGIGFTGTSVNPARSFGPAIMSLAFGGGADAIAQYWVFLVAPLAGGALAAVVFKFLNKEDGEIEKGIE